MKIAVDARSLLNGRPRGEGRSLLRLYQELAAVRPDWRFRFFGEGCGRVALPGITQAHVENFQVPGYRFNLWENVALPCKAWCAGADLLHCSSSSAPRWTRTPIVLTVHDVIPLLFNDGWTEAAVSRFRAQLDYGLRTARVVIAVSDHTKRDILSLFDVDEGRIHVVHWGIDIPPGTETDGSVRARLGIGDRYVMAFGGGARRKNTAGVIAGFAAATLPDVQLVLAGLGNAALRERVVSLGNRYGVSQRLRLLDYLEDSEINALLDEAECLLYPSLYEGFGLPVLEAMSRGVPVIASNTTSIPEVAGDAAVLVDPLSSAAISAALVHVCGNPGERARLAQRGRERAARFSWRATGEAMAALFEQAAR